MRYEKTVFCIDLEMRNWNTNVKVLNCHDVIITSKWRHKVVKLRHSVKYSDYFIIRRFQITMTSLSRPNDVIKSSNYVVPLNIATISLWDILMRSFALTRKLKTEIRIWRFLITIASLSRPIDVIKLLNYVTPLNIATISLCDIWMRFFALTRKLKTEMRRFRITMTSLSRPNHVIKSSNYVNPLNLATISLWYILMWFLALTRKL